MENLFMPTRVIYGKSAVQENASVFKEFGKNCLIVTGGSGAKKSGALSDAQAALESVGVGYSVFDRISANPLLSVCYEAGKIARKVNADFILGIGGGSALDSAKAIAIFAANPDLAPADIYKRVYNNAPLKVALIGTTAGTGSEVTGVSVLTNDETGRKKSISGPDCYPAVSLCDYTYTCSMPYEITVSTALDAFAHAVEGYFTPKATGIIDLWAEKCIPEIYNALCVMYETKTVPDEKLRDCLYKGSLYAGLVINTCGTAFPHPLGYVLTENYGVPHGKACAAFFPAFFERAQKFSPVKAEKLCSLCCAESDEIIEVVSNLAGIDIKITDAQAEEYSQRWAESVPKNFVSSPGSLTREEAKEILASL
ncbi:MAG: iron-containing alcohol dehydrogenase [Clostridia bacterium]|nr:iron-containing alcohol dehydrogenase [Clostridia bacterium]